MHLFCLLFALNYLIEEDIVLREPLTFAQVDDANLQKGEEIRAALIESYAGEERLLCISAFKEDWVFQAFYRARLTNQKSKIYLLNEPQWLYMTSGYSTTLMGFDGEQSWIEMMGGSSISRPLPDRRTSESRWYEHVLVMLANRFPFAYLKNVELQSQQYVVVRVFHPETGAAVADLWIDAKTQLVWRRILWEPKKSQDGEYKFSEIFYADYQKVDGVSFPFKRYRKGNRPMEETVIQIVVNPPIEQDFARKWPKGMPLPDLVSMGLARQ